ncbi:hypothetical protein JXB12_00675 [candidate division KSB1 bacterium]|nr:hypothetical protein [candidate division KSB1 bacterium]
MDIVILLIYISGLIVVLILQQYPVNILEESMVALSKKLKLSSLIAGATLIAASSSSPEFGTAFAGVVFEHEFDIGFNAIMWSAIFNILVITGASGIASKKTIKISDHLFTRDLMFYFIVLVVFLLISLDEKIVWYENLLLILIYLGYLYYLLVTNGEDRIESRKFKRKEIVGMALLGSAGVIVSSIFLVRLGVLSLLKLGDILNTVIPVSVIACTFWGPGTSIVDLMMSISLSKKGHGESGIVNGIASNTFDIAICLGFNGLLYNILLGDIKVNITSEYFLITLVLISLLVITILLFRKRELNRRNGILLIVIFCVMLLMQIYFAFSYGY